MGNKHYDAVVKATHPAWTGAVNLVPSALDLPLRWKRKPRRIFVNSMSDLFHEKVKDEWIAAIFGVMMLAGEHTYQVLTKRPERMRDWMRWLMRQPDQAGVLFDALGDLGVDGGVKRAALGPWPKPHIWLGVSVEDQATADERIPLLLETPATVRWVSYEPALGPVRFDEEWLFPRRDDVNDALSWIVVGGESGPDARPFDLAWARRTIIQGQLAGAAVFVKQLGREPFDSNIGPPAESRLPMAHSKGGDWNEWPTDLRVREYPVL